MSTVGILALGTPWALARSQAFLLARVRSLPARACLTASLQVDLPFSLLRVSALASGIFTIFGIHLYHGSVSTSSLDVARAWEVRTNAHSGSGVRVTSTGGLYDAATLCVLVMVDRSEAQAFPEGLFPGFLIVVIAEGVSLSSLAPILMLMFVILLMSRFSRTV